MLAILDYGAGNVASVANVLHSLNTEFVVSSDITILQQADKILFPGVGHASFAMNRLHELNLIPFIQNFEKPFLGICLGMQVMCTHTEEGNTECLNIIPVKIKKFPPADIIPHTGWNEILHNENMLFKDIPQGTDFYFVHSYYAEKNPYCRATCTYILEFCCAVQKENFWGVQFHPEKSAEYGKKIIQNFLSL